MTKAKAVEKSQVRSADPDAVRATVYFPKALYGSMNQALLDARRKGRKIVPHRLTLSALIVHACDFFITKKHPDFRA